MSQRTCLSKKQLRAIATHRLKRDLIELRQQNDDLPCIAAQPTDDNLFEWHANIRPHDGVYSGVCFHLILNFPDNYPSHPPNVKICTPISHPNVFDSFICLSMLRPHTGTVPYEGWSAAYSITSILMQLQSFLFADKIDQDGGYQVKSRKSKSDLDRTIQRCLSFKCHGCGHSHDNPQPAVQDVAESLIKVYPCNPTSIDGNVYINGTQCQSTWSQWISAYGQYGVNHKISKIMYEVYIDWTEEQRSTYYGGYRGYASTSDQTANFIIGFGTKECVNCGDRESFGYRSKRGSVYYGSGGTSLGDSKCGIVYDDKLIVQSKDNLSFKKNDTICMALDFDKSMAYFCKNGACFGHKEIPKYLLNGDKLLFPTIGMKQARVEFNFGTPRKPCNWLIENGFKTFEEVANDFGVTKEKKDKADNKKKSEKAVIVDWHNAYIIDELWVDIFEYLRTPQIFSASFVCKKWFNLIADHNIMERSEIYCFFSKDGLVQRNEDNKILGIGLSIKESEVGFQVLLSSQMDILSLNAWNNGCRIGVWGEPMTHFLPLAMNRQHAEDAHDEIMDHLRKVCKTYKSIESKSFHGKQREENPNFLEQQIKKSECLQMVDTLITMMNKFVVEFVAGNKDMKVSEVNMVMCEKVVLGYCALHHLLLYLQSKNKKEVTWFANRTIEVFKNNPKGENKWNTRDLGKVLIYLMMSKYQWSDIAHRFVTESFTRRTKWFVDARKHPQYARYDCTRYVYGRVQASFIASATGRKLVMFQVWFMKNSMNETLQGYNQRLGRPTSRMRNGVVAKVKYIMASTSYVDYFKDLDVQLFKSYGYDSAMDQMLRFAVWNSYWLGYHYKKGLRQWEYEQIYQRMDAPKISVGGMFDRKKMANNAKCAIRPIRTEQAVWQRNKPQPQMSNQQMRQYQQPMIRPVRPQPTQIPQYPNQPQIVYQQPRYTQQQQAIHSNQMPLPQAQRPRYAPQRQVANMNPVNAMNGRAKLPNKPITTPPIQQRPATNPLAMTGRAKSQNTTKKVSNPPKTNVNGTTTLSKAQKRKLRMQRKKSGISEKVQKEVSKRTHAIMATYVQSSPSISAETPNQTPIPTTTKLSQENEPKLSKAQKRKLRMQKGKNRPTRPPMTSNKTVQSGPTRPPLPNRNSIKPSVEKNDEKLSKAQRRKLRKKRMNGCI